MAKRLQHQHLGLLFLALYLVGCSLNLSPPPPDTHTLAVSYLPGLVKGRKPTFPPARVLVLLPVDKRPSLKIRDSTLPITGDGGEIVGIHGLNSRDGTVSIAPQDAEGRNMVPALGVLRTMDSGMRYPPDIPQAVYTLPGLPEVVQGTIATHFCEAGFYVEAVPFSLSTPLAGEEKPVPSPVQGQADYALGCTIEEFSLLSLVRYEQIVVRTNFPFPPHIISRPIRGPTQAAVSLALSLYHWPSGEMLWQGKTGDIIDDPTLGDSIHLYGTAEETLTVALSRAVGSILNTQGLQDVLLSHRPSSVGSPAQGSLAQVFPSPEKCGSMPQK